MPREEDKGEGEWRERQRGRQRGEKSYDRNDWGLAKIDEEGRGREGNASHYPYLGKDKEETRSSKGSSRIPSSSSEERKKKIKSPMDKRLSSVGGSVQGKRGERLGTLFNE